ncbi:MAG: 50S ribosomal protein L6 [Flavobacteriales bacterium]|nr:50S ribosomal protein L6 [Flavobacteriales bacterium]
MSRVGKNPISLPQGVEIKTSGDTITVKGSKGELSQKLSDGIGITVEDGTVQMTRVNDSKSQKALHGLYRALVNNMVVGVSQGYTIRQEVVGVGYKASNEGNILELNLGYSHNIFLEVPKEIKVSTETVKGKNPLIILEGIDKQLIGQVASKIRSLRKPEPYKGKGIRFEGETIRRKAGKSAAKK